MNHRLFLLLTLAAWLPLTGAAEESRAHIPYKIPDGTPPPPAPPKTTWKVPAEDIIDEKAHTQGGRTITIRQIQPIPLPAPPQPAEPAAPVELTQEMRDRIAAYRENHPRHQTIALGATVHRLENDVTRSHLRIWLNGKEQPITLWSSGDFSLLSGIGSFKDKQGKTRALFMMWSIHETNRLAQRMTQLGRPYTPPVIPDLPTDKISYVVQTGQPDPDLISALDALHEILSHDDAKLRIAYEGRMRAARERAEHLKVNPPQPKDITINYWRVKTPAVKQEGGEP
jgi:hypothetical protein